MRTTSDGGVLRLKDVARVELGAMQYAAEGRTNGQLSVPIAVYLGTGANALETAEPGGSLLRGSLQNLPHRH